MTPIIALLLVSILLVVLFTVVTLVLAVRHAKEGHEDEQGFHPDALARPAGSPTPSQGSENPWDYVHGANCPLHLPQQLGSLGNSPFSLPQ